jgi:adenylate kinase family enzyme
MSTLPGVEFKTCYEKRIAIIGTTGCGKSTLAQRLARSMDCPYVELDALFWGPNWTPSHRDAFRERVSQALSGLRWIVGGNYSSARDIIWRRAEALVWLDYPLPVTLGRLFRRTLKRIVTQEELWSGNRESWRAQFLSRQSLFLYALQSHYRRRVELPSELRRAEYAHLKVLRFHSPHAAESWLRGIEAGRS